MKAGEPSGRDNFGGVIAITVTYVYFLLYAQFGFVSYVKQYFPDPIHTEKCMGAMGLGGLLFSILAATLLRTRSPGQLLATAFAGCSISALITLVHASVPVFIIAAFLIGACTGLLTVTLAAGLRHWISGTRFGLHVGAGTGIAYLICNIPWIFDASPHTQTLFSAIICLIGFYVAVKTPGGKDSRVEWIPRLREQEFRGLGFASVVVMFFALVWLDSTAFATIQLTEDLRMHTWGTPGMKIMLGIFHALAAIAAGWLIDRNCMRNLLASTFVLFVISFTLLQSETWGSWMAGPLYACGISAYSTALVAFPSLHPDQPGLVPIRWRAALLFAIAGWFGSGLGVGLAQHLHSIPFILLFIAALLVGCGLLFPLDALRREWIKQYSVVIGLGLLGMVTYLLYPAVPGSISGTPSVEYGRHVYKQEGCIHCHSQYLRPRTSDVLLWGPYRDIDRTEKPPMIGNRRQGPDLMNAGLRRTALWHRQHLMDPQSLSPGSKMPSYQYLFMGNGLRGESLVLYLASLGTEYASERASAIQAWVPEQVHNAPSLANGRKIFETYCYMCHGLEGRADGPLASIFNQPSMKLTKGSFTYVPDSLSDEEETEALARIVTFGLLGLHMPGHEYFDDQDVLDVVSYVRKLAASTQSDP